MLTFGHLKGEKNRFFSYNFLKEDYNFLKEDYNL